MNVEMHEIFERDLENVLYALEKVCRGNAEHVDDYVKAYKYFVDRWSPIAYSSNSVAESKRYNSRSKMSGECDLCGEHTLECRCSKYMTLFELIEMAKESEYGAL